MFVKTNNMHHTNKNRWLGFRSSLPELLLEKSVLKTCSKFTREHLCQSEVWIKLQSNFIEITFQNGYSPVNLLHIFMMSFLNNSSRRLLLGCLSCYTTSNMQLFCLRFSEYSSYPFRKQRKQWNWCIARIVFLGGFF